MIDVWCIFGELVVDPNLLAALPANLGRIDVELKEIIGGQPQPTESVKSMGLLDRASLEGVQKMLDQRLLARFAAVAPPVSLYAAGRMCRLKIVDGSVLSAGFFGFHQCYLNAYGGGSIPSKEYSVAIGACLVDDILKGDFVGSNKVDQRCLEFRLDKGSAQFSKFRNFLNDPNFDNVQTQFLLAECWERTCPDKFVWYDDHKSPRIAN